MQTLKTMDFDDFTIRGFAYFVPYFIGKWKFIEPFKILGLGNPKEAYWVHDSGLVLPSHRMIK